MTAVVGYGQTRYESLGERADVGIGPYRQSATPVGRGLAPAVCPYMGKHWMTLEGG